MSNTEWPYGLAPNPELAAERGVFLKGLEERKAKRPAAKAIPEESCPLTSTVTDNPLPPDMPTVEVPPEIAEGSRKGTLNALDKNSKMEMEHREKYKHLWLTKLVKTLESARAADVRHEKDRKAKADAQTLAKEKWQAQPGTTLSEMVDTIAEIFRLEGVAKPSGKPYAPRVIRNWICGLAPPEVRKPGRRRPG